MKIGIAGAGIIGQLLAFACVNRGYEVTLFAPADKNCSQTAAGLITPIAELEKSDYLIYELGMQALQMHWPAILHALKQTIYFSKKGSLLVSHPNDQVDLKSVLQVIKNKLPQAQEYITECNTIDLEPELSQFKQCYYFSEEGQIDNQTLMQVLTHYLKKKIRWHERKIQKITSYFIETEKFDWVMDCRGLGAKKEFAHLQAVRGELIWIHAPMVTLSRPIRLMHPRYRLYVVPRPDHDYIIGASEIYADDYSDISVRTTLELLTAAYYIHPGFAEARICHMNTHCRPTLPHHLPSIKAQQGHIAVNGLYRHGFLIAPTLVSEIMNFIEKGESTLQFPQLWNV